MQLCASRFWWRRRVASASVTLASPCSGSGVNADDIVDVDDVPGRADGAAADAVDAAAATHAAEAAADDPPKWESTCSSSCASGMRSPHIGQLSSSAEFASRRLLLTATTSAPSSSVWRSCNARARSAAHCAACGRFPTAATSSSSAWLSCSARAISASHCAAWRAELRLTATTASPYASGRVCAILSAVASASSAWLSWSASAMSFAHCSACVRSASRSSASRCWASARSVASWLIPSAAACGGAILARFGSFGSVSNRCSRAARMAAGGVQMGQPA